MEYEYGSVYDVTGEGPDLPDDAIVHVYDFMLAQNYRKKAGEVIWHHVNKFRIVDERYKPKPDESSWYEKGYHPEVGAKVDYEGTTVEVIARDQKLPQVCVRHGDGQLSVLAVAWLKPLRTERDKLIEQMCDDAIIGRIKDAELNPVIIAAIERLTDKGYRKIKQQSEDEFVSEFSQIKFEQGTGNLGRNLYRAGCRFVEVGDE